MVGNFFSYTHVCLEIFLLTGKCKCLYFVTNSYFVIKQKLISFSDFSFYLLLINKNILRG